MLAACLQLDLAWEDERANRAAVEAALSALAAPRGSLVVDPEMCDTGFVPRIREGALLDGEAFARSAAGRAGVHLQHGCLERAEDGMGRNLAVIAAPDGGIVGRYRKLHPFGYGAETRGFRGGDGISVVRCGDALVAPFICYDLRFPEAWRLAALAGAEVFTIGASWPAVRHDAWRALCVARAIENQAFVVACNRTGRDPNLDYRGGSLIVSPLGEILAEGDERPGAVCAELDLAALRAWRERFPALRDVRRSFLGRVETDDPQSAQLVRRIR